MHIDNLVVIVTVLALLLYLWTGVRVAAARGKFGVAAPAVTGHPEFERAYRVQMNTLEWLPLFLAGLWLFAFYWGGRAAAALGVLWILARLYYALAYVKDPARRGPGFGLQALATLILLLGALIGACAQLLAGYEV
jgi:glutathione S-transferase